MAATAAAAQTQRSETLLKEWEFRKGHDIEAIDGWEKVTVPHDWAIYGPFDKANDLQTVAVVQNGEDIATEKTGRTGGLPYMGIGAYRRILEISEAELDGRRHILMFDGAMSEAQVIVNGAKVSGRRTLQKGPSYNPSTGSHPRMGHLYHHTAY